MKLGLIARSEIARGIAIQSRNFYDHMPVERVLLVDMPKKDCDTDDSWYPGATKVAYDTRQHQLDEPTVRKWLEGLDVVWSVETPNDWRMPGWCREMGVKLVVQGNPEFVRQGTPGNESLLNPDEWWWPTSWRMDKLPPGVMMPVPMDDDIPDVAAPWDGVLRILHVVGKRAHADRNGTGAFFDALRSVKSACHVSVYAIDGSIEEPRRQRNLTFDVHPWGVENRWEMYRNQHLLVLPRRYGGLCLPALEAAASGLAVMMPDCQPNDELASLLVAPRRGTPIRMACGVIESWDVRPLQLSAAIDFLGQHPARLSAAMAESRAKVPRWSTWKPKYLRRLMEVAA